MLHLSFLGNFSVTLGGEPIAGFESDKARALLAYLAVEAGNRHRREHLTCLFWPEKPEKAARHNLSQVLYNLRTQLERTPGGPPFVIDRQTIGFRLDEAVRLDVHDFQANIHFCDEHRHSNARFCRTCLDHILAAVESYRGDFLSGLSLPDCDDFEDWVRQQRERNRQEMLGALERACFCSEQKQEFERAAAFARRWTELDPLNEAACRSLMRNLAHQGLLKEALAQFERCRDILAGELGISPNPETTGLQRQLQGLLETGAGGYSANQLPEPLTTLIDRQSELDQIERSLADSNCRILTLVGPGGIGKTRLALEAAARFKPDFPDGVILVELNPQASGKQLLLAIAHAANLDLRTAYASSRPSLHRDLKAQVFDHLRGKKALLVLDNFESVIEEAPVVGELQRQTPGVKVLATSHTRLNLFSERIIQVAGLPSPQGVESRETFLDYAAVRMFVEAAKHTLPEYELTPDHFPGVLEICRITQGLPLGLTLAASWVEMLTPEDIAVEIQRNLDFLSSTLRDLPERQRSLRATFDYSLSLLAPEMRSKFIGLALFSGGFSAEHARQIVGVTFAELRAFAHHSLLWVGVHDQFQMHDLLRQYAREKLAQDADQHLPARQRFCAVMMHLLAEREPHLYNSNQFKALKEIDRMLADLQQAWDIAVETNQRSLLEKGAAALARYYYLRGQYHESVASFKQALTLAENDTLFQENLLLWARLNVHLAVALDMTGNYPQAIGIFQEIDQQLQGIPKLDPEVKKERAVALQMMGHAIFRSGGSPRQALAFNEQGLALARECGDPWELSACLLRVAVSRFNLGDYRRKQRFAEEALEIQRRIGDPQLIASIETTLGLAYMMSGQSEKALQSVDRQNAYRLRSGTRRSRADASGQLGLTLMYAGRSQEANFHLDKAIAAYLSPDEIVYIDFYRLIKAQNQLYAGEYAAARSDLEHYADASVKLAAPQWDIILGYLHLLEGQIAPAENAIRAYFDHFQAMSRLDFVGHALALFACCAYLRGDLENTRSYLVEAIKNYLEQGYFLVMVVSLHLVAILLAESGQLEAAAGLYAKLQTVFAEENILYKDLFGDHIKKFIAALPPELRQPSQDRVPMMDFDSIADDYLRKLQQDPDLMIALTNPTAAV